MINKVINKKNISNKESGASFQEVIWGLIVIILIATFGIMILKGFAYKHESNSSDKNSSSSSLSFYTGEHFTTSADLNDSV